MYKYVITYRVDDAEYPTIEKIDAEGDSIATIMDVIASIEKRHTIISINNVTIN